MKDDEFSKKSSQYDLQPWQQGLVNFSYQFQELTRKIEHFSVSLSPFFNELENTIKKFSEPFAKFACAFKVLDTLKRESFVYWKPLPQALIDEIITSSDVDSVLYGFCKKNEWLHVRETASLCVEHDLLQGHSILFQEVISCFESKKYHIAALGFFALIDSMLTEVSILQMTNVKKRFEYILEKIENSHLLKYSEYNDLVLVFTVRGAIENIFAHSEFNDTEPICLNRHWIVHGRSKRSISKLDCIKLLNLLYGILLLSDMQKCE